jgi:uncharacterized protein (DUF111 family)
VKLARHRGALVNVQPEFDDVAAVAAATGRPIKDVLVEAAAASRGFHEPKPVETAEPAPGQGA